MNVFSEVEANGESARICVGVVVGNQWDAGGVREADGDRCGWVIQVRRTGERSRFCRRRKGSGEHRSLSVCGAKAGMLSEDRIEGVDDVVAQRENLLVCGKRHMGSPVSG